MRYQDNSPKNNKKRVGFWFFIFLIIIFTSLYFIKINKFEFSGDLEYLDLRVLKINSLIYLKDQSLFWNNKSEFENNLKSDLPQIKSISYKIKNSDTIEISLQAENICCVVKDGNEKFFVVGIDGKILREFSGALNSENHFFTNEILDNQKSINKNIINILKKIYTNEIKIEDVKDKNYFIEDSLVYFFNNESNKILINENTDFEKFNEKYKDLKSYLEQNQKSYSILDFRFEKIVVK